MPDNGAEEIFGGSYGACALGQVIVGSFLSVLLSAPFAALGLRRGLNFAQSFGATCGVLAIGRAHIDDENSQLKPRIFAVVFLSAFCASVLSWDILGFERVIRFLSGSAFLAIALSSCSTSVAAFVAHKFSGSEVAEGRGKIPVVNDVSTRTKRGKRHGLSGATKEKKDLRV